MKIGLFLFLFFFTAHNSIASQLKCAIANGYPPFQHLENKKASGLDSQFIDLFNKYNNQKIQLIVMDWSEAFSKIVFTKELDCLVGMEITDERKKRFHFSKSFYKRYSSLFLLEDTQYKDISTLKNKIIADDKDSTVGIMLRDKKLSVRLVQTKSKLSSFQSLKDKKFFGVISPLRVGKYLSKKLNMKTKVALSEKGIPIAIASKDLKVIYIINKGIENIPKEKIDFIYH